MANNTAVKTPLAVAASAETTYRYAEGDALVLTVYLFAFVLWTQLPERFISSRWKSVRATRRKGKLHVVLVPIPMPYICAYMYFQHRNQDYKEMGAALLALAFALLHLARTFMGLWQLHVFKQWAISSIKSMESLGYETRFLDSATVDSDESESDDDGGSDSDDEDVDGRDDDAEEVDGCDSDDEESRRTRR